MSDKATAPYYADTKAPIEIGDTFYFFVKKHHGAYYPQPIPLVRNDRTFRKSGRKGLGVILETLGYHKDAPVSEPFSIHENCLLAAVMFIRGIEGRLTTRDPDGKA